MHLISRLDQKKILKKEYRTNKMEMLEVIGPLTTKNEAMISLREITIQPGGHVPVHSHPYEEIYYFIYGILDITVEDETVQIRRFDSVIIPPNKNHSLENKSDIDAVYLIISKFADMEKSE